MSKSKHTLVGSNVPVHSRSRGVKKVLPPLDRAAYAKRIEGEIEAAECDIHYAKEILTASHARQDYETMQAQADRIAQFMAKQRALRIELQSYQPVTAQ